MTNIALVADGRTRSEISMGVLALLVCVRSDGLDLAWNDGGCLYCEVESSVGLMTPNRDCKRDIVLTKTWQKDHPRWIS